MRRDFWLSNKCGKEKGSGIIRVTENPFSFGTLKILPMVYKSYVSCMPKTHVSSFMTLTLFVCIWRGTHAITQNSLNADP